jgi:hypothetical protein
MSPYVIDVTGCPALSGYPVNHCIPDTRFLDFAQKSNFATEPP